MAWAVLGDTLGPLELVGLAVAAAGVAAATIGARPTDAPRPGAPPTAG